MEAPKEIYVHELSARELADPKVELYHVKYVRADLANLTWKDVMKIHNLCFTIPTNWSDSNKKFYSEVLRRFNEQREKK